MVGGWGDGCRQVAQWRLPVAGGGRPTSVGMAVTRGGDAVATRGAGVSAARGAGLAAACEAGVATARGAGVSAARGAGGSAARGAAWQQPAGRAWRQPAGRAWRQPAGGRGGSLRGGRGDSPRGGRGATMPHQGGALGQRGQLEPGGALGRVGRGRGTGRSHHRGHLSPPHPSDCMPARGRGEWGLLCCAWERLERTAWPRYSDGGNGRERHEGKNRHPLFSPLSRPSGESDGSGVRLTPFLGVLNRLWAQRPCGRCFVVRGLVRAAAGAAVDECGPAWWVRPTAGVCGHVSSCLGGCGGARARAGGCWDCRGRAWSGVVVETYHGRVWARVQLQGRLRE